MGHAKEIGWLEFKFAVGAEPYQFKRFRIGLAIDQDQIRVDMTISVVAEVTC